MVVAFSRPPALLPRPSVAQRERGGGCAADRRPGQEVSLVARGERGALAGWGSALFIGGGGEVGGRGVFMATGNGATAAVGRGSAARRCSARSVGRRWKTTRRGREVTCGPWVSAGEGEADGWAKRQ